jgi:hypothetical protein
MDGLFILGLVALTSLAGAALALKGSAWPARALGAGLVAMLEAVGAGLVCYAVNLAAGIAIVLGLRAFVPGHLSLYVLNDIALLALSLLQGLALQGWRVSARAAR